ncbi:MAG: acyl carrier protein [Eubacteriales bacterium]|nr:acyl carrier protein [Eubacteriales bacterium]
MVFEKICALIRDQLPVDGKEIELSSRLVEDLGADSANVMMLIMDIEQEFAITVDDSLLADVRTVGDIVKYLEENA